MSHLVLAFLLAQAYTTVVCFLTKSMQSMHGGFNDTPTLETNGDAANLLLFVILLFSFFLE